MASQKERAGKVLMRVRNKQRKAGKVFGRARIREKGR